MRSGVYQSSSQGSVCALIRSAFNDRLQNKVVREGGSHLFHCLSFDIELFMLFQLPS